MSDGGSATIAYDDDGDGSMDMDDDDETDPIIDDLNGLFPETQYDVIIAVVHQIVQENVNVYGASCGSRVIFISSTAPISNTIAHEIGHSVAGLDDIKLQSAPLYGYYTYDDENLMSYAGCNKALRKYQWDKFHP